MSYKATELREMARGWLGVRYPGALIVNEFSIGSWGGALIDVAAITENEIIGIEIKGAGDSPTRLKLQGALYSKAATRMFLLTSPELHTRCAKVAPDGWGKLLVDESGHIKFPRQPWQDTEPPKLCVAPGQLLQALWRDELDTLALENGISLGKITVEKLRAFLADELPLKVLIPATCRLLRARVWMKSGGAVGFAGGAA